MTNVPSLPPAAFDITRYRAAVERATHRTRIVPALLVVFTIAVIALIVGLIAAGVFGALEATAVVALGIVGTGALLALLVVLPSQVAARRRREYTKEASVFRMAAAAALTEHLASIGYLAPISVTSEWIDSSDSGASVPLVHDSVIAARWWTPTEDDDRIFVEPFLRRGDLMSSLPALPPLAR